MSVIDRRTISIVLAILQREWRMARSYRAAFGLEIISGFLGVSIYYFISQTFATASEDLDGAPSYFAFALVGVVTTLVIQTAALGIGRRLREEQLTGTLEATMAQPLRDGEIAVGLAAYPFINATIRSLLFMLVAGLLLDVDFSNADWIGAALVAVATVGFVLGLGLVVAAFVLLLKRADVIASLATFMLALFGGAYFPVEVLPGWLEWISVITPTRLSFDGLRAALYNGEGWAGDASILGVLAVVAIPLGILAFSRSLERQRSKGTLAEY